MQDVRLVLINESAERGRGENKSYQSDDFHLGPRPCLLCGGIHTAKILRFRSR